jgi:hypothetical protein
MANQPTQDGTDREAVERPEHGARLLVRLAAMDPAQAEYSLSLATAEADWRGRASVGELDGQVVVGAWESAGPPEWLIQAARALLRSAWQRRRAGHPWPRRLARWRPSPGEAGA